MPKVIKIGFQVTVKNVGDVFLRHSVCHRAAAFTAVASNGCRAPTARQLLGDIAYLEIQLTGFDLLYVTASEYGYYVIHVSNLFQPHSLALLLFSRTLLTIASTMYPSVCRLSVACVLWLNGRYYRKTA